MKTDKAINEFIQSRRAADISPATIRWYCDRLKQFLGRYPKLPTKTKVIQEFLEDLPGSRETRYGTYRAVKTLYIFLQERHGIPNPVPPRHRRRNQDEKLPPTLEDGEMMRLVNSATNPRDRAILSLLLDTGIRVSELTGLRKADVKIDTIRVTGKSGERDVPISEEVRLQLLSLADGEGRYVFVGRSKHLSREEVYRIVAAHMKMAGISGPKLGPHRIRHAFGRSYLVNGGDLRSLQQLMGHKKISTTERYASLNLNDVIAKHHKFTPLRAAHAAAQESFFNYGSQAVKLAEEILAKKDK